MNTRLNARLALRCAAFVIGMIISACGIATVTNAHLGTTPITAIPLVLNTLLPLTVGVYTAIFSMLLIVLQKIVLGPNFRYTILFQIPASLVLSAAIDFWLHCTAFVSALPYAERMIFLVCGIVILAGGVLVQVLSNVCIMPGDGLVLAVAWRFRHAFGSMKVLVDSSMVGTAAVIGLAGLGTLVGIREGTVLSAACTGLVVRAMTACLVRMGLVQGKN